MNLKIEYNFLDITNLPSIEKYFERKASEGWLIHRIFLGSIFLFKKMEPSELTFSILPYEISESQEVSKNNGWTYVTESYDSHIYYQPMESVTGPIQKDEEKMYQALEEIARKRITGNWIQIFLFLILGWFNIGGIKTSVTFLKDGANQLLLPIIGMGLLIAIWYLLHMKRFLTINRENRAQGEPIQYSQSLFIVPMITFFIGGFFIILLLFHFLYLSLFLRDHMSLVFFFILLIGLSFGSAQRYFEKKNKNSGLTFIILLALSIGTGIWLVNGASQSFKMNEPANRDAFKVLTNTPFSDDQAMEDEDLYRDFSLFVPTSYDYYYANDKEEELVATEYSKGLTKGIAKDLTERYLDQKKKLYSNLYEVEIKRYFEEGVYDNSLLTVGITEDDLIRLKSLNQEKAEKTANKLVEERSITSTNKSLWNADEAYFLNYAKDEILIRSGREVFYLLGKDFSDPAIVEVAKFELQLNEEN